MSVCHKRVPIFLFVHVGLWENTQCFPQTPTDQLAASVEFKDHFPQGAEAVEL